jgi:hypothetical protein
MDGFIVNLFYTNRDLIEFWTGVIVEMSVDIDPPISEMPLVHRDVCASEIPFLTASPQFNPLKIILKSFGFKIVVVTDNQSLMPIQTREKAHEFIVVPTKS